MDPKQQLAELIDAFASAKSTGNETLQRIALQPLQQFLESVDIVPIAPPEQINVDPEPEE